MADSIPTTRYGKSRDTIKSLKAEIEELRAEIVALRAHVATMPQHDWTRPIGPRRDAEPLFPGTRELPKPWDDLSKIKFFYEY